MKSEILPLSFPALGILAAGALVYIVALTRMLEAPAKWVVVLGLAALTPVLIVVVKSRKKIFLGLLAVALALPYFDFNLFYDPRRGGDFRLDISLLDLIVAIFLGQWLREAMATKTYRPAFSRFTKTCITGLLLAGSLSLFGAPNPALGVFELVRLIKMTLLCFVIACFVRSQNEVKTIIIVFLFVLFLEGGLALLQQFRGQSLGLALFGEDETLVTQEIGRAASLSRVGGTLGHANRLAIFWGLFLPIAVALALPASLRDLQPGDKILRLLARAALIIGVIALLYTLSRAGWIAFIAASLIVIALIWRHTIDKPHFVRVVAIGLFLLAAIFGVYGGLIRQRVTGNDRGSFATRLPMAQVALSITRDHPVWGAGIGNYREWLPRYHDPEEPFTQIAKVHNVFLLIAAEMGVVGLATFLILMARAWWKSWHGLANLKGLSLPLAIGILGGFIAFAIHGLVDYIEISRFPALWFSIGLLEALPRINE